MGLNDTYAAVKGQILLMDPIPSLTKVFSHLVQMRSKRKLVLERSYKLTQLLWQQRTILQRVLLRSNLGAPNAPTVVIWVIWIINAITCMVTPLVISSSPRVNMLVLLLTILLLLKTTQIKVSISLMQNISNCFAELPLSLWYSGTTKSSFRHSPSCQHHYLVFHWSSSFQVFGPLL